MGLLSFLFGGSSRPPAPPTSRFHPGQVWAFTPPPNHLNARLTILRVENGGKLGTIVHIAISGISYGNGQTEVPHLPFAEAAIERSVTTLERESGPVPEYADGYQLWREAFEAGQGGVFTISVAEVVDTVIRISLEHAATVKITFGDVRTPDRAQGGSGHADVSTLSGKHECIHGRLSIVIGGKPLPCLGYFGPDDVCLGAWLTELQRLVNTLSKAPESRFVYDEGEQGQPAFQFERHGDRVEVSIVNSEFDGVGIPDWGVQTCQFDELTAEIERFSSSLRDFVINASPLVGAEWWETHLRQAES